MGDKTSEKAELDLSQVRKMADELAKTLNNARLTIEQASQLVGPSKPFFLK